MTRRDKINYYLDIAETVAERGTCLRRNFGAIIVKNDQIVSTGYVGAPRGRQNCSDLGYCTRDRMGVPRGQRYHQRGHLDRHRAGRQGKFPRHQRCRRMDRQRRDAARRKQLLNVIRGTPP